MSSRTIAKSPEWIVVFKHAGKDIFKRMPGGLHEAEAIRCAALKVARWSQFVRIYRAE